MDLVAPALLLLGLLLLATGERARPSTKHRRRVRAPRPDARPPAPVRRI